MVQNNIRKYSLACKACKMGPNLLSIAHSNHAAMITSLKNLLKLLQRPVIICLVGSFFLRSLLYHSIWEKKERIFAAARLMGCKVTSKLESEVLSSQLAEKVMRMQQWSQEIGGSWGKYSYKKIFRLQLSSVYLCILKNFHEGAGN